MKKSVFILIIISLYLTVSCSEFLKENPRGNPTLQNFFKTEADIEASVNRLYREGFPLMYSSAGSAYSGPQAMLGGHMSGYFDSEFGGQEIYVTHCKNLARTAENIGRQMKDIWQSCYTNINRVNVGLKYAPGIKMSSDTSKATYIAELKCFRAMNYFYLVKTFGDVPLTLTPYESLESELYLERTPSKQVYDQIISDLKEAASNLPKKAFYKNNNRLTQNIANTLLGNVYLQMSGYPVQEDHYAEAAKATRAVIQSGKHSLTLNDDYEENSAFNKLRTIDGLDEVIYAYEFDVNIANSGWWPTYSFPNSAAGWNVFKYSITANIYKVSNGLLNMYSTDDIRGKANQFFHWEYKYSVNGVEVIQNFEPANWYYFNEDAMLQTGIGGKDVNIYRYSEVLLMAAEAIAKSEGVTDEALSYLAKVKARASVTGVSETDIKLGLPRDIEGFVREVWAERLREFPLEFKIWDDIIRTRQYPQFSKEKPGEVSFIDVDKASNNWGKNFTEKDLLWPIASDEIARNPKLIQNPGY